MSSSVSCEGFALATPHAQRMQPHPALQYSCTNYSNWKSKFGPRSRLAAQFALTNHSDPLASLHLRTTEVFPPRKVQKGFICACLRKYRHSIARARSFTP